jgi:hypothetical protein
MIRDRNAEFLQKLCEKNRHKEEKNRQLEERLRRRQVLLRDRLLQKSVESRVVADIGEKAVLPPKLPGQPEIPLFPGALQPSLADLRVPLAGSGSSRRARSWNEHRSAQASLSKKISLLEPIKSD